MVDAIRPRMVSSTIPQLPVLPRHPNPACFMVQGLYLKANGEMPCWDDVGEELILRKLDAEALVAGHEANISGFAELLAIRVAFAKGLLPHPGLCDRCAVRGQGPPVWEMRPTTLEVLHVEPSFLCHLSCPQCIPAGLRRSLKEGPYNLAPAAYESFLEQLRREGVRAIRLVIFEGRGDPLNNSRVSELVRLTKTRFPGAFTSITTHGNFPFKPWMLECGLDLLRLSVDGAFPTSYARYRVGGRLETPLRLMRDLRDEKGRTRARLHVEWKYLLFEWNDSDEELREAARLASELGARLRFCQTHSPGKSRRFPDAASVKDMISRLAPAASPEATFQLKSGLNSVLVVRRDQVTWLLDQARDRQRAGQTQGALEKVSEAVALDPGLTGEISAFTSEQDLRRRLPVLVRSLELCETASGLASLMGGFRAPEWVPPLLARYLELSPEAADRGSVEAYKWASEALQAEDEGRSDEANARLRRLAGTAGGRMEDPLTAAMSALLDTAQTAAIAGLANLAVRRGALAAAALLFARYLELAPYAPDRAAVTEMLDRIEAERLLRLVAQGARTGPREHLERLPGNVAPRRTSPATPRGPARTE